MFRTFRAVVLTFVFASCALLMLTRPLLAQPQVLFRLDDMGMNHSVNRAIERVADSGMRFSVSVLFVGPWYQEAVEILKRHPDISVGVHMALNSEWKNYRWGPVLGASAVPSLVDDDGYFVHSTREFLAKKYDLGEVEREFDAQIERALQSGLKIDYVDYHMGTAISTPELRAVVERVAAKHHLAISRYFDESRYELFSVPPEAKRDSLLAHLRTGALAADRYNLFVIHVAEATPEMAALFDMNAAFMNTPSGVPLTYKHRQAELDAMLSPQLASRIGEKPLQLVTYRDVVAARGLEAMRRPVATPASGSVQYRSTAGIEYRAQVDTGAIARAESALAANPRNVERIIQLGIAQSGVRQFREAIATFTRVLAIAPNDAMLYRWRGHRYLSVRELDRAMSDLTRGFRLDSTNHGVLYHLGIVRYARGDFAGAADAFARAQRRAPEPGELAGSTDWLWMSLMRAGRRSQAKAMLDRRPDTGVVTNAYARRLKLYRGEIGPDSVFTPADTSDIQVATLSYGLGNWYLLRNDTARARDWFQRSVRSGGWPAFGFIISEVELRRLNRAADARRAALTERAKKFELKTRYVPPPGDPLEHHASGFAKVMCSAVFITRLNPDFAAENVGYFTAPYRERARLGKPVIDVGSRAVHVSVPNGVTRTARYYGDQGCVTLPIGKDSVSFTPRRIPRLLTSLSDSQIGDARTIDGIPAGFDTAKVQQAVDAAFARPEEMTAAFVVTWKGRLVGERYGEGITRNTPLESWSMGKSVTATLMGILVKQGVYKLTQPAPIPEWQTPGDPRAKTRIVDILHMSSGLRIRAPQDPDYDPSLGYPDHLYLYTGSVNSFHYAATRPQQWPPNTVGRYRNTDPVLINYLIRLGVETRGEDYLSFPRRALFDKIGVRTMVMETDPYGNFLTQGYELASGRDWARLGNLYLQDGVWNGERILPEGWAKFVSTLAPAWKADGRPVYGGFFWINGDSTLPVPREAYYMSGAGGQTTLIVPSHDLVVVRLGHYKGSLAGESGFERALAMLMDAVPSRKE